jgi:type III secretory pathway component EscU
MNPIIKNIIAVIAGLVVGSIINMGIIMASGSIIPPPEDINPADMESLKEGMHLF